MRDASGYRESHGFIICGARYHEPRQPGREDRVSRDTIPVSAITGLILCGGRGSRMGGRDKGLLVVNGRALIEQVLVRLSPQVARILISANRHLDCYRALGWPVVSDDGPLPAGPLAGLARGLKAASTPWVLTVPCDCPWLPLDLASRLAAAVASGPTRVAMAHDGEREQFGHALVNRSLHTDLAAYLDTGERRLGAWLRRQHPAMVDFSYQPLAFTNLNKPDDFARAEALATRGGDGAGGLGSGLD